MTNNELDKTGQIVLNSMHKFQPRVHLVLLQDRNTRVVKDLADTKHKTWVFSQTVFTAVTAYQNQLVGLHQWMVEYSCLYAFRSQS